MHLTKHSQQGGQQTATGTSLWRSAGNPTGQAASPLRHPQHLPVMLANPSQVWPQFVTLMSGFSPTSGRHSPSVAGLDEEAAPATAGLDAENWKCIPCSPAPMPQPTPVTPSPPPSSAPSSPRVLHPLQPLACSRLPPPEPAVLLLPCSWCPDALQSDLPAPPRAADSPLRVVLEEPVVVRRGGEIQPGDEPAEVLRFSLEELVVHPYRESDELASGQHPHDCELLAGQYGWNPQSNGVSTSEKTNNSTEITSDSSLLTPGTQSEDGEQFIGFLGSDTWEQKPNDEVHKHGSKHHSNVLNYTRTRRRRGRRFSSKPKHFMPNLPYYLRRKHRMSRLHRLLNTREKRADMSTIMRGVSGRRQRASPAVVPAAAAPTSQPVPSEEAPPPAEYAVPAQFQLLEVLPAPAPESSGLELEAAALGYSVAAERGPSPDLPERLLQTVQQELDRLGYPAPHHRRGSPLEGTPEGVSEEEWRAWRHLMPPRRGRPTKLPRADDLNWILQVKQLGVRVRVDRPRLWSEVAITDFLPGNPRATRPPTPAAASHRPP